MTWTRNWNDEAAASAAMPTTATFGGDVTGLPMPRFPQKCLRKWPKNGVRSHATSPPIRCGRVRCGPSPGPGLAGPAELLPEPGEQLLEHLGVLALLPPLLRPADEVSPA